MGSGHRFRCAVNVAAALFPCMSLVVPLVIVTPLGFALDHRRCRSSEFWLDRRCRSSKIFVAAPLWVVAALLDLLWIVAQLIAVHSGRVWEAAAAAAAGVSVFPLDKPQLHLQPHKVLGRLMCELALLTASAWSSLQSAERVTNTGLGPALAHMIVASLNDRIGNGQDDFQPQDEAAWLDAISEVHRR
jgi:hypothetical protein